MKRYLIDLICACDPDNGFAQDAIEYALISGWVTPLTYNLEADVRTVMGQYDAIISSYQSVLRGANQLAA